jgi:hypothetical protein
MDMAQYQNPSPTRAGATHAGTGRAIANNISSGGGARSMRAAPVSLSTAAKDAPVQRIKILAGKEIIHLNEYHFIHLLHLVKDIGASGEHDVVITIFTEFNELGDAAKGSPGKEFEFQGIVWGWKGDKEIFPNAGKSKGKGVVTLSSALIGELGGIARDPATKPTAALAGHTEGKKALEALLAYYKKKPAAEKESDPEAGIPLSFSINLAAFPASLKFASGKEKEAFVWGLDGDIEGWHYHLIFETAVAAAKDGGGLIKVKEFLFSATSKNHRQFRDGKWRWQTDPPDPKDQREYERSGVVLETLIRHGAATGGEGKEEEEDEKEKKEKTHDVVKNEENAKALKSYAERAGLTVAELTAATGSIADAADYGGYNYFYQAYKDEIDAVVKVKKDASALAAKKAEAEARKSADKKKKKK